MFRDNISGKNIPRGGREAGEKGDGFKTNFKREISRTNVAFYVRRALCDVPAEQLH